MSFEFDKPWLAYTHYVYELYAEDGICLYVGCTFSLGTRLNQHVNKSWWSEVTRIEVNAHQGESAGLCAEKNRIQFLNPVHNSVFTDHPTARAWARRRARDEERNKQSAAAEDVPA